MKISLVITTYNEQPTIVELLDSVAKQSLQPNEVVIVDAGSEDETVQLIKAWKNKNKIPINLQIKKSNRSEGRNFAVEIAKYDWIAITDAGCILDKDWLKELGATAVKEKVKIVAGYYKGLAKNNFEQAVVPYVLVMPDRVNENDFLPATRSMLIHRSIWQKYKGLDETLDVSEDYQLAKKIKAGGEKIAFARNAVVGWKPKTNLFSFYKMVMSMARDDARAGVMRWKVWLVFIRYLLLAVSSWQLVVWGIETRYLLNFWLLAFGFYVMWSIKKNIKHVPNGWYYLPILQITADVGVMVGSVMGLLGQKSRSQKPKRLSDNI